ncbi:hypothetical protein CO2235_MP20098 [Cupriavidus oxalaticus]|uniref:Uncharacterized protein n=1 Tax=Cupriavidus oxalaticus TaxID=96344 RepID=A0A375GIH9_9BURK|nr:hypothetical protein CO2235_MP20098 [Cupriavidus oxalaticus]
MQRAAGLAGHGAGSFRSAALRLERDMAPVAGLVAKLGVGAQHFFPGDHGLRHGFRRALEHHHVVAAAGAFPAEHGVDAGQARHVEGVELLERSLAVPADQLRGAQGLDLRARLCRTLFGGAPSLCLAHDVLPSLAAGVLAPARPRRPRGCGVLLGGRLAACRMPGRSLGARHFFCGFLLDAVRGTVVPDDRTGCRARYPRPLIRNASRRRHCNQHGAASTGPAGSTFACYCG